MSKVRSLGGGASLRDASAARAELFEGINMLLPATGANIRRPFPYTPEDMLRKRRSHYGSVVRWLKRLRAANRHTP